MFFFKNKKRNQDKVILRKTSGPIRRSSGEKPVRFMRIVFYSLVILFFGITIYVFFFSNYLEIKKINIEGTVSISREEISDFLSRKIEGKYVKTIPKNNYLFISNSKMSFELSDHFKKIETVSVNKTFPNTLEVAITERDSLLLWCSGDSCFIIDKGGYAYTGASLDSPEVMQNKLIKMVDTSSRAASVGDNILSPDFVSFLIKIRKEIEREDIVKIGDEWKTPSAVSDEVEITTEEGWRIYFSAKIVPAKAERTLKTFLSEGMKEGQREKLEYVDLRVENKVYYKLKSEEKKEEEGAEEKIEDDERKEES